MGIQNIEQFFWAVNGHASVFIQHNNDEQYRLSKLIFGDNSHTVKVYHSPATTQ
jgi:hypothetical protein